MGGPRRTNIGFPLLVLFEKCPISVDWSKEEVMSLCGYHDRLMSSRRIVEDKNKGGKSLLVKRCLQACCDSGKKQ